MSSIRPKNERKDYFSSIPPENKQKNVLISALASKKCFITLIRYLIYQSASTFKRLELKLRNIFVRFLKELKTRKTSSEIY